MYSGLLRLITLLDRVGLVPSVYRDFVLTTTCSFLPARRSKRGNSYGNVSGWVAGWVARWLSVTLRLYQNGKTYVKTFSTI